MQSKSISRRDFLKVVGAAGIGSLALGRLDAVMALPTFPTSQRLGRFSGYFGNTEIRAQPHEQGAVVKKIYEDYILEWNREVIGTPMGLTGFSRTWIETPEGYVYAPFVQPVKNLPNEPLQAIPEGLPGFWAEVTVPYVDFTLENAPSSPWLQYNLANNYPLRLYYSQILWVDQIRISETNGQIIYRLSEPYSGYDIFWAEGTAFRPLTEEDIAPIHPEVDPAVKKVFVNLTDQTMSCYEGNTEVYFCRISSGGKWASGGNTVDAWSTPIGEHWTWRKAISIHMAGGTVSSGSWDTPAITWNTLFSGTGVAIHSTFWHNDFGTPRSHGCINARPEDAKWVFRWSLPNVSVYPGDITIQGDSGTHIVVSERLV
ncbi:MAG: L,D-transpeptidase [Anaerolineales bacterium]|nr:L,D-transpeptidase [Anaerolineales bacterium]